MKKLIYLPFVALFLITTNVFAQKETLDSSFIEMINIIKDLKYEPAGSKINLGSEGSITIPKGFKFVNGEQSEAILTKIWGNPPGEVPLGMLFPENGSPVDSANGWAFVIRYDGMGYIKDDEADEINYDDLLVEMKDEMKTASEERSKEGYGTVELIGWASKPFYDKIRKTLHWAKEAKFDNSPDNTLNYDVRVLGRNGLFSLNAIGGMQTLPVIKPYINDVIASIQFSEGNKYSDFNPSMDKVAAVGIGGLVAGKVLAKVGFFAILLKFWKVIAAAVVFGGGAIGRFFTGKSKNEENNEENG